MEVRIYGTVVYMEGMKNRVKFVFGYLYAFCLFVFILCALKLTLWEINQWCPDIILYKKIGKCHHHGSCIQVFVFTRFDVVM